MPTFDVSIHGKSYHIEIPDPGEFPLTVIVDGQPFEVKFASGDAPGPERSAPVPTPLHTPARAVQASQPGPAPANGGSRITAPMPGTILSVEVISGATVDAGEILCVLEAMKMKNPIRATAPGTVAQIAVQPGQNVKYGDLLVLLA